MQVKMMNKVLDEEENAGRSQARKHRKTLQPTWSRPLEYPQMKSHIQGSNQCAERAIKVIQKIYDAYKNKDKQQPRLGRRNRQ